MFGVTKTADKALFVIFVMVLLWTQKCDNNILGEVFVVVPTVVVVVRGVVVKGDMTVVVVCFVVRSVVVFGAVNINE